MDFLNKKIGNIWLLIKNCLITGLLVLFPICFTLSIIGYLIKLTDKTLFLIPEKFRPDIIFGFYIPFLGVIFTFFIIFITGLIVTNFLGQRLLYTWDALINKIPIVRSIYKSVKKIAESIFSSFGGSSKFTKVVLIEYPRKEVWTVAFLTGDEREDFSSSISEAAATVFVPTTPNPTSGFLLIVPKKDIIILEMSVEKALRTIISLGVDIK